jgi:2-polyprenyl-3-methyl-5-hydroxy-6-metoxy-1,4-benzoquinol methylase
LFCLRESIVGLRKLMSSKENDSGLRCTSRPNCDMCGASGVTLYTELSDGAFGTPGSWGFRRCPNQSCGLIWLEPTPLPEELSKAYKQYFTHQTKSIYPNLKQPSFYKLTTQAIKRAYCARRFRYPSETEGLLQLLLSLTIYLSPLHRAAVDMSCGHLLRPSKRGRLLDIGCGAGELLSMATELGWNAEGIDVDSDAVATARGKGLTVVVGELAERCYPDESFDLLQMSHVIEHVSRPAELLRECRRLLRPEGSLVIWTPNSESFGHMMFGRRWANLDPPRHLQLWNTATLRELVLAAGFQLVTIRTGVRMTPNIMGYDGSSASGPRTSTLIPSIWKQAVDLGVGNIEQVLLRFRPLIGEEIILEARK